MTKWVRKDQGRVSFWHREGIANPTKYDMETMQLYVGRRWLDAWPVAWDDKDRVLFEYLVGFDEWEYPIWRHAEAYWVDGQFSERLTIYSNSRPVPERWKEELDAWVSDVW